MFICSHFESLCSCFVFVCSHFESLSCSVSLCSCFASLCHCVGLIVLLSLTVVVLSVFVIIWVFSELAPSLLPIGRARPYWQREVSNHLPEPTCCSYIPTPCLGRSFKPLDATFSGCHTRGRKAISETATSKIHKTSTAQHRLLGLVFFHVFLPSPSVSQDQTHLTVYQKYIYISMAPRQTYQHLSYCFQGHIDCSLSRLVVPGDLHLFFSLRASLPSWAASFFFGLATSYKNDLLAAAR